MLKGFEYNKNYRKISKRSLYDQECELLHEFLGTENENIRFEYGNEKEANNARQGCARYAKEHRMPLKLMQRGVFVFAVRTKKGDEEK